MAYLERLLLDAAKPSGDQVDQAKDDPRTECVVGGACTCGI